jgi:2C-methyl-D-erythritol 2,4-cyclodiphosphate synthase
MNRFLLSALQTIVRALIGALNYERIKSLVTDTDATSLSGDDKRALVVQEAQSIGLAVGYALVNLAIETAVNSLRNQK